jgi:hypothetical protein
MHVGVHRSDGTLVVVDFGEGSCFELSAIAPKEKLFVLLSARAFLSENARKKSWKLSGRGASTNRRRQMYDFSQEER